MGKFDQRACLRIESTAHSPLQAAHGTSLGFFPEVPCKPTGRESGDGGLPDWATPDSPRNALAAMVLEWSGCKAGQDGKEWPPGGRRHVHAARGWAWSKHQP